MNREKTMSGNVVNLTLEDLPHEKSNMEWWYYNCHFHEDNNPEHKYSFFFSFFKVKDSTKSKFGYFVVYALIDHQKKTHIAASILDKLISKKIYTSIEKENTNNNPFLSCLVEIMKKETGLFPDRLAEIDMQVQDNNFYAKFGNSNFRKKGEDYFLTIDDSSMAIDLKFHMLCKPVLHGHEGITLSDKPELQQMFYYFLPYGEVTGSCNSKKITGTSWYDHEYSINNENKASSSDQGWVWFAVQLENKEQLSIYHIYDQDLQHPIETIVQYIDKEGNSTTGSDFTIEKLEYWQSSKTLIEYPVKWKIVLNDLKAELLIETSFPDQEISTVVANPAFYEGSVSVEYKRDNQIIKGMGFVEIHNLEQNLFSEPKKLIEAASNFTVREVEENQLLQDINNFGDIALKNSILSEYINDIPYSKLYAGGLGPLRDMVLRKGKCWRSLICFICINAVGGNSEHFRAWAGIIELIQSGTLILDDIQDNSKTRRGKETVHELYGLAKAINGGLLGFFLFNSFMDQTKLDITQMFDIYNTYFNISAGTVLGQCADVEGMQDLLFTAIQQGDNTQLLKTMNALHALKTGSSGNSLAVIGGILGGGTPEQINKMGNYAFKIGLAFQYIDDAIAYTGDERSFENDVMSAKITLPIALAIPLLSEQQKLWLMDIMQHKKREELTKLAALINELGIIDICNNTAKSIVAEAWEELEPHLPDSIFKVMLYYAGIFILDIHSNQKT